MLGLSGKEETVRIIIFQKSTCRTQTNVEKWSFLEIYNKQGSRNIVLFYRTVEFR
jgi:hypothetical protein